MRVSKMSKYKKRGYNDAFPDNIETWRVKDPAPTWITDVCRVNMLNGIPVPVVKYYSKGGFEIYHSGTMHEVFISTNNSNSIICRDVKTGRIIILQPEQLELLYDEVAKKT